MNTDRSPHSWQRIFSLLALLMFTTIAIESCRSSDPVSSVEQLALESTTRLVNSVDHIVVDTERADRARIRLKEYREQELGYFAELRESRGALSELNTNYKATRADFKALTSTLNAHRRAFMDVTIQMFTDLKSELNAEEWEQVFEEMRAMDAKWEALAQ